MDFEQYGVRADGRCFMVRKLPDYDIAAIRTGQYIPGEGRIWEGSFDLNESTSGGQAAP